jgi:hypothetical protein
MKICKNGSRRAGNDPAPADENCANRDVVIAEWQATKTELIRVIVRLHDGRLRVDVRRWFYDASRKLCPGNRGVSLTTDDLGLLRRALRQAERELDRRNLV